MNRKRVKVGLVGKVTFFDGHFRRVAGNTIAGLLSNKTRLNFMFVDRSAKD